MTDDEITRRLNAIVRGSGQHDVPASVRLRNALAALSEALAIGGWVDERGCDLCGGEAPVHASGPTEGEPCGAVEHADDCPYARAVRVLRSM